MKTMAEHAKGEMEGISENTTRSIRRVFNIKPALIQRAQGRSWPLRSHCKVIPDLRDRTGRSFQISEGGHSHW